MPDAWQWDGVEKRQRQRREDLEIAWDGVLQRRGERRKSGSEITEERQQEFEVKGPGGLSAAARGPGALKVLVVLAVMAVLVFLWIDHKNRDALERAAIQTTLNAIRSNDALERAAIHQAITDLERSLERNLLTISGNRERRPVSNETGITTRRNERSETR